jgi:hypothetical protein
MVSVLSSASWPAISTPVGPPPTMTTVNPAPSDSARPAMSSRLPQMVSRTLSASTRVYIDMVYSAAPGIPKWFVVIPLPMIK